MNSTSAHSETGRNSNVFDNVVTRSNIFSFFHLEMFFFEKVQTLQRKMSNDLLVQTHIVPS